MQLLTLNRPYRTTQELYYTILNSIKEHGGAKPTHIMFYSRLPYVNLQKKLKRMITTGLLEYDKKLGYRVTEQGEQYIRIFKMLKTNLKEYEE
jgi:predicted transcriptional regulator